MFQITQVLCNPRGIMWHRLLTTVCTVYWADFLSSVSLSSAILHCRWSSWAQSWSCLSVQTSKSSHYSRGREKNANSLKSLDPWDPVLAHLSYDPFLHAPAFNQAFPSSCTVVTFCNMSRKDHFHIRHVNQWQEASLAHYRHWFLSLTSSPVGPGTCKTDRQTMVYCGLRKWDNLQRVGWWTDKWKKQ